jgi:phenylalanyl-tRNA synthetase alpha chain
LGFKTETDYRITKGTGWLEIMGCGIDPNVLKTAESIPKNITVLHLEWE